MSNFENLPIVPDTLERSQIVKMPRASLEEVIAVLRALVGVSRENFPWAASFLKETLEPEINSLRLADKAKADAYRSIIDVLQGQIRENTQRA